MCQLVLRCDRLSNDWKDRSQVFVINMTQHARGWWDMRATNHWFMVLSWMEEGDDKVMAGDIRWWTYRTYLSRKRSHTHIILVVRYDKMVVCVRISFEQMFRGIWMSRVYSCKSQVLCWDIPQLIFASKYKPIYVQYNLHIGVDCLRGHVSRLYLPKLA